MSLKVRLGISFVILSAIVAIIIIDMGVDEETPAATASFKLADYLVNPPESEPTEPPPPPPGPARNEYVVKEGDTYQRIARKVLGDSRHWRAIAAANPGVAPGALRVGRTIVLPEISPEPLPPTEVREYVVKPGDTLSEISQTVYGTARRSDEIFRANRDTLEAPDRLKVGMKLVIPAFNP